MALVRACHPQPRASGARSPPADPQTMTKEIGKSGPRVAPLSTRPTTAGRQGPMSRLARAPAGCTNATYA
jgi:hypothetical protein